MKINNFISLLVIGVLAILLFLQKCQTGKQVKNLTTQLTESSTALAKNSLLLDSLQAHVPDTIRDTVTNTVIKRFTVTKTVQLIDTINVPNVAQLETDTQIYTSINAYDSDVVTDTILLCATSTGAMIVNHKQDAFITKDTVRITTTIPITIPCEEQPVVKPNKQGFAMWAGIRSDYRLIPHPMLSFSYRDFMLSTSKGINKTNDFAISLQAKIRFR